MFKKDRVAVDGFAHANRAIDCAADLASKLSAELVLLYVVTLAQV
jgi:nucleotide-binding universal stress UspA family protein